MSDTNEILSALLGEYLEIENELEGLEFMKTQIRMKIQTELLRCGGKWEIPGFVTASITPGSVSHSYDTKAIDALLAEAVSAGDIHTAQRLSDSRKTTNRRETLRITKIK